VEKLAVDELLRQLIRTPCVMVTDKPGSDGAAQTGMDLNVEHRQHKGLNNRTKNAHLLTLRRKRIMKRIMKRIIKRFTSARHLKRLVFIHDPIANLHTFPRYAMSSSGDRALRSGAIIVWREIAEPGIAAQRQGKAPRGQRPVFAWPPFGKLTVPARSRYLRPSSKAG
jgi:putative transposase